MPDNPSSITHRFQNWLTRQTLLDRFLVPVLLLLMTLYTGLQVLAGNWLAVIVSAVAIILMTLLASSTRLQTLLLRRPFETSHAFYIFLAWVYSLLWLWTYNLLLITPSSGKDSRFFYVFLILFLAISLRALLSVYALSKPGFDTFISQIPLWEQILVAINEFLAAGLFAYVLGGEVARWLQPDVFTIRVPPYYSAGLLITTGLYYGAMQAMWFRRWNRWLSLNRVWVRLARLLGPPVLLIATLVISRHFAQLTEPRSASLLGTADLDQTVLALSPIVWMMVFYVCLLVYTGSRGLRRRFLPQMLMNELPSRLRGFLATISDMDILLIFGFLSVSIPLQIFLFDDSAVGVLDVLRQQISRNAIIDTSEQALALLFALPFYVLTVALLSLYAYVMLKPTLSAQTRNALVERLPITLLIVLIITLYLGAIPFSRVLSEGRIPRLPQELGYVLAFNVLIPLILLYAHYFVLIRIPYGQGQSRWRRRRAVELRQALTRIDNQLSELQTRIDNSQQQWDSGNLADEPPNTRINSLYSLITLNGKRDRLNMERLQIVSEQQELAEVTETPVSLTVARLPARVFSYGIPLILAFKIYEWAIVNDGLREVASNPNIGVFEFFQTVLENTNF
jgi:hypothetical protein